MSILGPLAILIAAIAAGWLVWRSARSDGRSARNVTLFKGVVWLGLAAALFVAKLWPLAFMLLLAAGGVTAIETWREKEVGRDNQNASGGARAPVPGGAKLSAAEAASVLGVAEDADAETIKSAHKKLIAQLHPDKGGTDYLAAKINEARETLLRSQP